MLANFDTATRRTDSYGRRESVKYSVEMGCPVGLFWRFYPGPGFLGRVERQILQVERSTESPPELVILYRPCCFRATEGAN